jgi:recombinational DNA repair protein (RecF pathway)
MTRPEGLPAYVLHSRAYRESGAIVDFLTRDFGRVSLFATGVGPSTSGKRRSNGIAALLQPFTAVLLTWRGANDEAQHRIAQKFETFVVAARVAAMC